jgi:hypothetical protein
MGRRPCCRGFRLHQDRDRRCQCLRRSSADPPNETLKALIDAAHKRGKLAVVHIGTQRDAHDAIAAGADGLAHLFSDSAPTPDFARFVAAHQAFVVPTLTVLEGVGGTASGASLTTDARLAPYLTGDDIGNLKRSFPKFPTAPSEKYAEQAVAQLKAARVPVLAERTLPTPELRTAPAFIANSNSWCAPD